MIRKAIMFVVVAGALTATLVATSAVAGNTPSGVGSQGACAPGSCFAPNYVANGEVAKYKGPAATTVVGADCCVAGDTYKLKAGGPSGIGAIKWTSSGELDAGCSGFPHPDTHSIIIPGGVTKAQLKLIASPGGLPAGAYIGMDAAGWVQTSGPTDACGF
jgi:hypothetical protein